MLFNMHFQKCSKVTIEDNDETFSNSLIIHYENTKEIIVLLSVWKLDEKVLIFASLISPFKIVLFEK